MKTEKTKSEKIRGKEIELFHIDNEKGLEISLMSFGATLTSVLQADRNGRKEDITLGFDSPEEYIENRTFFGASIGRFGNRIAGGCFTLNGKEYRLSVNEGKNQLHGGFEGFDRQIWKAKPFEDKDSAGVVFSRISPEGEEGYPGKLEVEIRYSLTEDGCLEIDYTARTDKDTVINLTNHTFWNLAGTGTVEDHIFQTPANRYLPVDETLIPLGIYHPVEETDFDFRKGKLLGDGFRSLDKGYDQCFVLPGDPKEKSPADRLKEAGTVYHEKSGRKMEVFTNQPGFQLYTAGHLSEMEISGKRKTGKFGAVCLETQNFPDSPNQPDFPSSILRPGETYIHRTVHRLSAI